jgi:hypothetical protein
LLFACFSDKILCFSPWWPQTTILLPLPEIAGITNVYQHIQLWHQFSTFLDWSPFHHILQGFHSHIRQLCFLIPRNNSGEGRSRIPFWLLCFWPEENMISPRTNFCSFAVHLRKWESRSWQSSEDHKKDEVASFLWVGSQEPWPLKDINLDTYKSKTSFVYSVDGTGRQGGQRVGVPRS